MHVIVRITSCNADRKKRETESGEKKSASSSLKDNLKDFAKGADPLSAKRTYKFINVGISCTSCCLSHFPSTVANKV